MQLYPRLHAQFPALFLQPSFDFARHTTIGCGGMAEVAAFPSSVEESAAVISYLAREHIPTCYLGAGANVLPADGTFAGVVVLFRRLDALYAEGTDLFAAGACSPLRVGTASGGSRPSRAFPCRSEAASR